MTMTFYSPVEPAAPLPYRPAAGCADCRLRGACLPRQLNEPEVARLGDCIDTRVRLKRDDVLFSQGDAHSAIYAVRLGTLRSQWQTGGKASQVTGFHLPGELLGFSGLFDSRHGMTAMALENTEVCVIRLDTLDALTPRFPQIQSQIRGFMSAELARLQQLLALNRLRVEQRIAVFLLDLSDRYAALGYSADRFCLRMTYGDIGNLLGMTLATVSRLLAALAREHVLAIDARQVEIVDRPALRALARGAGPMPAASGPLLNS